jgi:hypothetical protein
MSLKAARPKLNAAIKAWGQAMEARTKTGQNVFLLHALEYAVGAISELPAESETSEELQEAVYLIADSLSRPATLRDTVYRRTAKHLASAVEWLG